MQPDEILSTSFVYFFTLLIFTILIILTREVAIRQYRSERADKTEKTRLGLLGDSLSNTPSGLYNAVLAVAFFLNFNLFLEYLREQPNYDVVRSLFLLSAGCLVLLIVIVLHFTIRGKVYLRTGMIEREYQALGHEDLIIRKNLVDLVYERESENYTQSEIARRVIESLMKKENRTGDAAREIIINPERLRDMQGTKPVPSQWRSLRFTLVIAVLFIATVLLSTWGSLNGYLSQYDVIIKVLPIAFILVLAFVCCLCLEGPSASAKTRRARYGI